MKKILFALAILGGCFYEPVNAQDRCGTFFNPSEVQRSDPARYQRYIELEQKIANYTSANPGARIIDPNGLIIIPVVVHVLYNTADQNISDEQIRSQIEVLNEDFRRLNADRVNTPAATTHKRIK